MSMEGRLGAMAEVKTARVRPAQVPLRYLFRRLTPGEPGAMAASIAGLGLDEYPGVPVP